MQQKRFIFRGGLIALFATLVTACGGGGGGGDTSGSPAAAPTQSASINPNVKVVTDAEIVASSTAVAPDGTVQIGVTKTQPLSVGDVVMMAPGVSGFSNGFAGKIVATKETAGNSTLTLKRAGLADVFSKLKINYDSTKNSGTQAGLRVSRVITAPGVKASFVENTAAPLQTGLYSRLCSLVSQAGVTFANTLECNGNKGTLSGKLSLTKDVGVTKTATGEKITAQWEAYFNLEDVKQVLDTNFDDLQSAVTSANENFHFEVSGKAAAGMRLTVPDEKSRFTFNVSDLFGDATGEELFEDLEWKLKYAEVKGLNADDKKGLIPVAGLVIDAACVAESIATGGAAIWKACGFTGALQDSVTFQTVSKPFSFILWAYINVDGELKLTGSFDIVKMEGYEFKKGLNYTHDGGAKLISAEASSPTISMLNVNGAVDAKVTLGSQLAMDVLIAGVRPAAVHIDIYKYTQNYHLEGKGGMQVYPNLLLSGEFCHYGNYEAASQLTVLAKLKASIGNPDWFALESGFEYKLEPKHVWATGTLLEPTCYTTTPLTYTLSRRAQNPNNEKEWQYLLSFPTSYRNFKASVGKWKLKLDGQNTLDITPDENGEVVVNLAADKFYTTELQGFHIFEEKDTALGTAVEALKVKANQAVQTPSTPTLGSNPATPWVGQTIALWLNTTWADIKTVVWNFGVGTADVVVQGVDVILGRSTAVSTVIATPGSQTVTASYRDTFGNLLGRGTFSLLAVTQGTSIVDVTSDSDTKPGLVANNGSTDDATPTISGIISAPLTFGQRVNVYDGNTQFTALAVVNGTTWTFTPPAPLIGGAHSFTAEVAGFDGTPGSRSAAYVVNVLSASVASVAPAGIVRTLTGSFDIAGRDLPTSGISITVPGDAKATCQAPNNLTASGFNVACQFYKLGAQTLEVRTATTLLGTVTVTVKTNVTGVTWTSPSTTSSGTVKFGETVVYSVAGVNMLADPTMGFTVQLCGVSNTEVGTPSNTLRSFSCNFNNTAGAVAGQMPGVVKDAPSGQVLLDGWVVAVEVPVAPPTATGKLNDTGITASQCYAAGSNAFVSCTNAAAIALNSHQDGMVGRDVTTSDSADGKLGFSYSTVGNYGLTECILDNVTGLIWEGKPATGTRANTLTYTNYDSTTTSQYYNGSAFVNPTPEQVNATTNSTGYTSYVNTSMLCGFNDWRIPTVSELHGLIDYSNGNNNLVIDTNWFPHTANTWYWTSNRYAGSSYNAWAVSFYDGVADGSVPYGRVGGNGYRPDGSYRLRLVRGSSLQNSFTYLTIPYGSDASNNAVLDGSTGLQWRRCSEGQTWNGNTCTSSNILYTHEQAFAMAAQKTGWRLPNIKELASITNKTKISPAIDSTVFPVTSSSDYWASSSSASIWGSGYASGVSFSTGEVHWSDRGNSYSTRLVR